MMGKVGELRNSLSSRRLGLSSISRTLRRSKLLRIRSMISKVVLGSYPGIIVKTKKDKMYKIIRLDKVAIISRLDKVAIISRKARICRVDSLNIVYRMFKMFRMDRMFRMFRVDRVDRMFMLSRMNI